MKPRRPNTKVILNRCRKIQPLYKVSCIMHCMISKVLPSKLHFHSSYVFFKRPNPVSDECKINKLVAKNLLDQIKQREKERFLTARAAGRNKRQNKIKSKNYHRHLKARTLKEYERETEELRRNNPKAFADRLMKAELSRIKERSSLKHRGGSKFAKMQKLRATYDTEAREAVNAMYEKSKELTKKREYQDSSDSEESDIDLSSESEASTDNESMDDDNESDSDNDTKRKTILWWQTETDKHNNQNTAPPPSTQPAILSSLAVDSVLDKSKPSDHSLLPHRIETSHEESDLLDPGSENFFRNLEEVCARDAKLTSDFLEEKEKEIERETLQDVDTFMPGWNSWTGPGTEQLDEARRQRAVVKAPTLKRRDAGRSHVIIKQKMNNEFRQRLVKSIPFPHNTPEQFESVISQPISREWNTETANYELTRPKVTIQSGHVIKPISRTTALLRDKDVERLVRQKKIV